MPTSFAEARAMAKAKLQEKAKQKAMLTAKKQAKKGIEKELANRGIPLPGEDLPFKMGPDGKPEMSPEDAAAAACWANDINDNLTPEQKRMAAQEMDKQNGNTQVGRTILSKQQR